MHYCFLTFGVLENAGYMRAREMGKALIQRGVRVSYVVDDCPANREFKGLDSKAEPLWIGRPRAIGQFLRRRRAIRSAAPDFVEVLNPHPKTLAPLAGLKGPRVVAMWDEPVILRPLPAVRGWYERRMASWLVRRGDIHLAATVTLVRELESRFGLEATYMPHAAYLPDYPETASPYERPTAAYMGNFFPIWDHDIILEAARILAKRSVKPPIVLMGCGPDEDRWKQFVRDNGLENVQFLGFTTGVELWRRLRHAHVLLFPIRNTLTNLTRCPSKTFAYAQARRPTLTCRVGEVAQVLGDRATYVECSPEAFADAIEKSFAAGDLPDVDYQVERQNWCDRADRLLAAIQASRGESTAGGKP